MPGSPLAFEGGVTNTRRFAAVAFTACPHIPFLPGLGKILLAGTCMGFSRDLAESCRLPSLITSNLRRRTTRGKGKPFPSTSSATGFQAKVTFASRLFLSCSFVSGGEHHSDGHGIEVFHQSLHSALISASTNVRLLQWSDGSLLQRNISLVLSAAAYRSVLANYSK